ncbi:MAG: HMA2 domain-containing protein [Polyangiales bacterium]
MSETALLAHASTGRTRLRIPSRRNDEDYFAALSRALSECPGIDHVEANPRTGSVLLLHTAERAEIFAYAEQRQLFVRPALAQSEWVLDVVNDRMAELDGRLLERSEGKWGLSSLGFYGLLAATGLQIYRGNLWPAAETLLQHTLKLLESSARSR